MITEATIIGAGLLTAAAASRKFTNKTGFLGMGSEITNNFMEENNMKTTGPIITETPKKSTDKRFEIGGLNKQISKLDLDIFDLSLTKPNEQKWLSLHENTNYRKVTVPTGTDTIIRHGNDMACIDKNGKPLYGTLPGIIEFCAIRGIKYMPTDFKISENVAIRKDFNGSYLEVFYPCISGEHKYVTLHGSKVFITDDGKFLGTDTISNMAEFIERDQRSKSEFGEGLSVFSSVEITPVMTEPTVRMIYSFENFETSKEAVEYNRKMKELENKKTQLINQKETLLKDLDKLLSEEKEE